MSRPSTIVIVGAGPNGLLVAGPPARPAIPHLQPQSNLVEHAGPHVPRIRGRASNLSDSAGYTSERHPVGSTA
jgi:hypothetical protein